MTAERLTRSARRHAKQNLPLYLGTGMPFLRSDAIQIRTHFNTSYEITVIIKQQDYSRQADMIAFRPLNSRRATRYGYRRVFLRPSKDHYE